MQEISAVIKNNAGIHCRPSSVIITERMKYPDVRFEVVSDSGDCIQLDSLLQLLSLALKKGDTVTIRAEGERAQEALERMRELFETEFDFPPRT